MSKIMSFLSVAAATLTTLASFFELTKPQYAVIANLLAAVFGAAGAALAKGFPGGQLATVLGVIGAAISAALSFGGIIPLDVAKYLTAAGAVIAALGKSLFGWKDDPAPRIRQ